ncbi:hypothetical protein [Sphingobacterium sp.]|uniref:hypothetical protein n=1 Tax=Sphingobacterium sp. TaxID=341027 RepID=UPI00289A2509|nr:hypothetical protein [Sphingobacterium sp.]
MKRKLLQIIALSLVFIGCSKEGGMKNPESTDDKEPRLEIQKQVNTFSKYLDKEIKSAQLTKGYMAPTPPPEFGGVVDGYVDGKLPEVAAEYHWLKDDIELQTVDLANDLPFLDESTTELQAANMLEANLYSTINFSNTIDISNPALKTNLNNLESAMVNAIKDDVKNAFLLDDANMSEAQSEQLAEQVSNTLKIKTKSVLENKIQSLNAFPQGLTPQQRSFVSMSLMASVSTLDDLVLMDNLDAVVTADIYAPAQAPVLPAKGLFGKIGKFFGKVIKSVAVVVASAAVIVVGTMLGYVSNHSNSNSGTNSDYTALTGALVGVGVVAKNSKKWWGWVGWNQW